MPTTYDDVSGDEPFRTKAERALHGEGEQKMPMKKDPDGLPSYEPNWPESDRLTEAERAKFRKDGDKITVPGEYVLREDDAVEVPADIEERLADIRKSIEDLRTTHPRVMALKLAIEALPGADPIDQMNRAKSYVLFIKGD